MHLYGTNGYIRIPNFYYSDTAYLYDIDDKLIETFTCEPKNSFCYEIEAAIKDIAEGKIEDDIVPHAMSIKAGEIYDLVLKSTND